MADELDYFSLVSEIAKQPSRVAQEAPDYPDFRVYVPEGETILLAVANVKGGVGKTTTAYNLAGYLSIFHKVLLLDFDADKTQPDSNLGATSEGAAEKQASSFVMANIAQQLGHVLPFSVAPCSNSADVILKTCVKAQADGVGIVIFDMGGDTRLPDNITKAIDLTLIPVVVEPLVMQGLAQTTLAPIGLTGPAPVAADIEAALVGLPHPDDYPEDDIASRTAASTARADAMAQAKAEAAVATSVESSLFSTGKKPLFVENRWKTKESRTARKYDGLLRVTLEKYGITDVQRIRESQIITDLPDEGLTIFSAAVSKRPGIRKLRLDLVPFLEAVHARLIATKSFKLL